MKKELITTVIRAWGVDKTIKVAAIALASGMIGAGVSILTIRNSPTEVLVLPETITTKENEQ